MAEIFKYQWIKGNFSDIFEKEVITIACLEENTLIIGTENGFIYIFSFSGKLLKKYKAHEDKINGISVDNTGQTIFSCSENGYVVSNSMKFEIEEKEIIFQINNSLKAICVEDTFSTKKERSFIVGTSTGQIIYHKHVWFSPKDIELFRGSSSPVTSIAWRGDVVAWADTSQVRVMNVNTQAAICYLNSPPNVGPDNPFPCHLFWESEYDLLVGWADSFRHLQLVYTNTQQNDDDAVMQQKGNISIDIRARLITDWRADTIICGLSSFDQNHILLLGYLPSEAEIENENEIEDENENENNEIKQNDSFNTPQPLLNSKLQQQQQQQQQQQSSNVNGPELLLVRRKDGQLRSADLLPMKQCDKDSAFISPESFQLLSNYSCYTRRTDYLKWNMNAPYERGGYRGLPPHVYIMTPHGAIVSRVRDVNDRITSALQQNNLKLAVELAKSEKHTLRIYQYHDLVKAHLNKLLNEDKAELAATECQRLIENDSDSSTTWVFWINEFSTRKRLTYIAPFIPIDNPRLPNSIYEMILGNFLLMNPRAFLSAIRKWGSCRPPLFDWKGFLDRVSKVIDNRRKTHIGAMDPWLLEAKAYLYTLLQQYDKALESYLEIEPNEAMKQFDNEIDENDEYGTRKNFQYVFDLIEKQNLFDIIKDKILRLVRLSPKVAENLLVRNIDKIPVGFVVKQLKEETELLHLYLHSLVTNAPDLYNTQDYAEFHVLQVSLYAHFAPKLTKSNQKSSSTPLISSETVIDLPLIFKPKKPRNFQTEDSDFLKFLKFSNYIPLEVALRECDRQNPPLYLEKIYILAKMGNTKEGLTLLLREVGDVYMAIDYVEQYNPQLWEDIVDHALAHHNFLGELLDIIGLFDKFNPLTLIQKLPPCMDIPYLRQRLLRLIRTCDFQDFINAQARVIQQDDTLELMTQLNHSQRKGMRINSFAPRCAGCGRPTSMPSIYAQSEDTEYITTPQPVWGLPSKQNKNHNCLVNSSSVCNSIVFLPNKIAYHILCYEKVTQPNSNSTPSNISSIDCK